MLLNVRFQLPTLLACGLTLLALGCGDDDTPKKGKARDAGSGTDAEQVTNGVEQTSAVWSMMGYDTSSNYFQPDEQLLSVSNAKDLVERWRFSVKGFPAGSPTVAEGKVFVLATGSMYALDLVTGDQVWEQPTIAGTASPAYSDGFVYVHAASGANLYKLNASDGAIVWGPIATNPTQTRCDGTSSPIVAEGKVLVGHSCGAPEVTGGPDQATARGGVAAFDIADGAHAWTYWTVPESGENGAMVWSTVSVDRAARVVFAATGNNYTLAGGHSDSIHAIDLDTGALKWVTQVRAKDTWSIGGGGANTGEDTDFGANPILAEVDGKKIVAAGDKGSAFWALDRENGEILWNYAKLTTTHGPSTGGVLMNGAFDGKYFYVAANQPPGEALLHVLDPNDGSDVIEPKKLGATAWGAPSLANGLLFVPVNNNLRVLDATTGDMLNSFDTGGTIAAGAAAIANGRVIVKSGLQYQFASDAMNNNQVICYGLPERHAPAHKPDAGAAAASGKPTFTGVYNDIIVGTGCSGSALCHGGDIGHLQMKDKAGSYTALVGIKAMGTNAMAGTGPDCKDSALVRVVPNKPEDSLLIKKLQGTQPCGTSMPPGAKLTADQITQVTTWIKNGAKND